MGQVATSISHKDENLNEYNRILNQLEEDIKVLERFNNKDDLNLIDEIKLISITNRFTGNLEIIKSMYQVIKYGYEGSSFYNRVNHTMQLALTTIKTFNQKHGLA